MKAEISLPEVVSIFKEIQEQPERIFEMIRAEIKENVGQYLSKLMDMELTYFLGRDPYQRITGDVNHRNGSYDRNFTLKGIGEVQVEAPRDRNGDFKTQVIPRSKRCENELRQDLCLMFLTGIGALNPFHDFKPADRQEYISCGNKQRQQRIDKCGGKMEK